MKSAIRRLDPKTADFIAARLRGAASQDEANELLRRLSGIEDFFAGQDEFAACLELLEPEFAVAEEPDRREYGDFQTPLAMTDAICSHLVRSMPLPDVIIEPTFGRGAFLVSALTHFPALKELHGVEIYEPYCWQAKFSLLELFIRNPALGRPRILLHRDDVYTFDFRALAGGRASDTRYLVLGNPPWVTNAELSTLNSQNLPSKRNIKALSGLDAMTGKANFDIGEYIILLMLDAFSRREGGLAMLAKNSVIRNLVHHLPRTTHRIGETRALRIDAGAHFGASVDASLFECRFSQDAVSHTCRVSSLDNPGLGENEFGYVDGRFVSDVAAYEQTRRYDGTSPYTWRQGVKHDCSQVMELHSDDGAYTNGAGQKVEIESDTIFPLAKSSCLRSPVVTDTSRYVIITQRKIGEDTAHLAGDYPELYRYLTENAGIIDRRKSSIYKGNPPFSIFGIGDYSFKPYKVAISGLYKRSTFSLIFPVNGRPVMLDDTCYSLGFDQLPEAIFVWALLNSDPVQRLLGSLVFLDAKRPYTKDVLMRIALDRVAVDTRFPALQHQIRSAERDDLLRVTESDWQSFLDVVTSARNNQVSRPPSLFEPAGVDVPAGAR